MTADVMVRPARTSDVRAIRSFIDAYSPDGRLLSKATVTLFEDIQEFLVAQVDDRVVGCGALHVMWADLGEVRTVAVLPEAVRKGVGRRIVGALVDRAGAIGVERVFCLTFEVEFFERLGFVQISGTPVTTEVFAELLRSEDEGVAEFLDLERVKPNTLGNTRMLRRLTPSNVS